MKSKNIIVILSVSIFIGIIGWYFFTLLNKTKPSEQPVVNIPLSGSIEPSEQPVVETPLNDSFKLSAQSVVDIPLSGPITKKKAELSGMAWIGDTLILMPQYPEEFGPNEGALFAISKQEILDRLDGRSNEPISPSQIIIKAPGLKDSIQDYEGFESIGVWDQTIYLTIESGKNTNMMGYLVSGTLSADLKEITLDTSRVVEIEPAIQMDNRTDEALIITQNKIFTFFEVNGAGLNQQPAAHVFGLDLTPQGTISFPNLEYRVTDAALTPNGEIWVINKVAPSDDDLFSILDPLKNLRQVERLVKLNYEAGGITLADTPPIKIKLGKEPRNWEGLVLLDDRGFLLVTDKSPDTMLGFIPMP